MRVTWGEAAPTPSWTTPKSTSGALTALLSSSEQGKDLQELWEACRQESALLSPPDSPHPGRQQLTFIFTSQDLSAAVLALKWGLEKAAQGCVWTLYAAGTNLTVTGSNKEIHHTGMSQECWATGIPGCLGVWVHLTMKEIFWSAEQWVCPWCRLRQGQGFGFASGTSHWDSQVHLSSERQRYGHSRTRWTAGYGCRDQTGMLSQWRQALGTPLAKGK